MSGFSGSALILRLFGSLEVLVHGEPLPRLRPRSGQWLLALLALRAGSEVERSWLADILWPESAHAQALIGLRVTLADLRRALGPDARRLRSPRPQTLMLDLAGADVDVLEFDQAIAVGDPASLEQAVALYRGALLEACAEEWVLPERERREQACLQALERLAAQARDRGDVAAAERYLRQAIRTDPLRESTQRALMAMLAADGNYAAAVAVYRELRERLHCALNAQPDPQTTDLFQEIRSQARERARLTSSPRPLGGSEPGRSSVRPLPSGDGPKTRPHNLPNQSTSLIGRDQEVAVLRERLQREGMRLLTLTGPGGSGKTRLALQVAIELLEAFTDGIFFVELASVRDPGLVASAIARVLAVPQNGEQPLLESLKQALREKQCLLLLDNFEHVIDAAPEVAELLSSCRHLKVLVTSREVLRLRGEKEFSVLPLSLPNPQRLPPAEVLLQYAAVALFTERVQAVRPGFTIRRENAAAVAGICCRLDGLPLAIELAAARSKVLTLEGLMGRLESRLKLLVGGARDLPARQQTLRDTIQWSYDLLDVAEKRLFRRLSVFVGGFMLEAVEAVCGGAGDLGIEVVDGVASLVDKSLLQREEAAAGGLRFRLLETVREFGQDQLTSTGELDAVGQRHVMFCLSLLDQAKCIFDSPASTRPSDSAERSRWLARLEQELGNLRAALAWVVERADAALGLRLAIRVEPFLHAQCYWREGLGWLGAILALPGAAAGTRERAEVLLLAGALACYTGELETSRRYNEESLAIARALGDRTAAGWSLEKLGRTAAFRGDNHAAQILYQESLAHFREQGHPSGMGSVLHEMGRLAQKRGDLAAARAYLEEALAIRRRTDSQADISRALGALGFQALCEGDLETAESLLKESLTLARAWSHTAEATGLVHWIARLAKLQGWEQRAARLYAFTAAFREETPGIAWRLFHPEFDEDVPALRTALGEVVFAAAWARGQAATLDEAIAYALEAGGGAPSSEDE